MTKTHLYGLTQKKNLKSNMAEISVRHPLSSIIKIATKSSCPEMLSFTYGEKILTKSSKAGSNESEAQKSKEEDFSAENESTSSSSQKFKESDENNKYVINGKDWFYVPDYAGEAASAVKSQILQIIDLISQ